MVCPEPDFRLERRPSFPEEEDEEELLVAGVSFHNVEEGLEMCDLEYEMCEEMEDQMVMVDNITSCNVVDNYLWLDEYKQNNNTLLYFTLASIHDIIVSTSEISSPLSERTLADPPRVLFSICPSLRHTSVQLQFHNLYKKMINKPSPRQQMRKQKRLIKVKTQILII